jgi:hypothetical protein
MSGTEWNINVEKMNKPYDDQWELMSDFMSLLDMRLYYMYKYHMWVGPENNLQNMIGLAVSRSEFEINLTKAIDSVVGCNLKNEEIADIEALNGYFLHRLKCTKEQRGEFKVLQLMSKFSLDDFSGNCLLLAFAVQLDKKYEKLFAYMQDDITKKLPTAETAIKLFAIPGQVVANYFSYFTSDSPLARFLIDIDAEADALFSIKLRLRERITNYLLGNNDDSFENGFAELFDENQELHDIHVKNFSFRMIASVTDASNMDNACKDETVIVFITGARGSGRTFYVKHAVRRINRRCLFINAKALLESRRTIEEIINEVMCESILNDGYLCFTGFEELLDEGQKKELFSFVSALMQNAAYLKGLIFITSEKNWKDTGLPHNFIKVDIDVEPTDENSRLVLWEAFTKGHKLNSDIDLPELASKFRFMPGQIRNAVEQAAGLCEVYGSHSIDAITLHKCCYSQVVMRLDTLATQVRPAYSWDDLVLPADQMGLLKEACMHVKYKHTVYHKWGFGKKVSYGRGLSMLFSGPPGTGKTMAAQVIANQLHMEMYKIQLSQIVSKYIGETEKNLRQVFEEAKNSNCILFFDETDALFGKRSEVKDSHDRHANIETAYLLQQMEEYDGVIVMATNLLQNIDAAFMRRINFVISFPFPDVATRRQLWEKMLSTGAPVSDDINLDFMAEQFKIAGGNIKNIVIHAAFLAAEQNSPISMSHLLKSAVNEQRKNNIIIVKEDLKEYADLVF